MKKVLRLTTGLMLLLGLWYWAETQDYFKGDYNNLTSGEILVFEAESNPVMVYVSHFGDAKYAFPRQYVDKVKLFRNKPFIQSLTSRTLKKELNADIVDFFNDSTNFHWAETTWGYKESEYLLRFYYKNKVIGKIYLCLDGCGMIDSRPFSPNMKFGGLTSDAQAKLQSLIDDEESWN